MNIKHIVLTGGPCAGKSTALQHIRKVFTERGFTTIIIPETASELIDSGIRPWEARSLRAFQTLLMRRQLEKEASYTSCVDFLEGDRFLFIYDRGVFDGRAYISDDDWQACLTANQLNPADAYARYNACIHLVTAAKGAEDSYSLDNQARTETLKEARDVDNRTLAAWREHPHHFIIDNSTDFNGKLNRLITTIETILSKD